MIEKMVCRFEIRIDKVVSLRNVCYFCNVVLLDGNILFFSESVSLILADKIWRF